MNLVPVLCLVVALCCIPLSVPLPARAQQGEGEQLFNTACSACHTINQGKRIGPDLAGIDTRLPREWTVRWIKSSQAVIASGDPYGREIFEEYNKILMPDNNLSDAQITSIIDFIAFAGSGDGSTRPVATGRTATEEEIRLGEALFVGSKHLEGGGPSCISCHDIQYDGIVAGGALARDLTDVSNRLGTIGVMALIGSSPFPAMKQAFAGKPITEDEAFMLAAFLQRVDSVPNTQHVFHYGARLFISGLCGAFLMISLLAGFWFRVKKRSVNHAIYQRQVKST